MPFYSIYCFEERVELYAFEQEALAVGQEGRLISTQKDYQCAYAFAMHLAQAKQLPLVDRAQAPRISTERSVGLGSLSRSTATSVSAQPGTEWESTADGHH